LTTRSLVADYLALCRNPLKDIHRWIVETKPRTRSAHARRSSCRPLAGNFGFRAHALHPLRGRWTRVRANGTKITVCLLDQEPVLKNMAHCDRYELRRDEEE